jgi:hypothetical protein
VVEWRDDEADDAMAKERKETEVIGETEEKVSRSCSQIFLGDVLEFAHLQRSHSIIAQSLKRYTVVVSR